MFKDERGDVSWVEKELEGCKFKDNRHGKRFQKLLNSLAEGMGESIPYACQDWANTKAAYRFFDNENISEQEILGGHLESTKKTTCRHERSCINTS